MSTTPLGGNPSSDSFRSLTPLHLLGVLLAAITGAIHLGLGVVESSVALFVAGVGFAVGIVAIIANVRRQTFIKLGIPFTAVQAVYYLATHFDQLTAVSILDKIVQVAFIAVLFVLYRRN